jgi:YjzC-like protein
MSSSRGPFHPGEIAHRSGQYRETGPRGGKGREVTVVKGEPFPPTTKPGHTYTLVDATKNKSGLEE